LSTKAVENSSSIDVEWEIPIIIGAFGKSNGAIYSRHIGSTIELAECCNSIFNPASDFRALADVNNKSLDFCVIIFENKFDGLIQSRLICVCEREDGTSFCQEKGSRTANAACSTSNGNLFVVLSINLGCGNQWNSQLFLQELPWFDLVCLEMATKISGRETSISWYSVQRGCNVKKANDSMILAV
jgi:hypothetical protein